MDPESDFTSNCYIDLLYKLLYKLTFVIKLFNYHWSRFKILITMIIVLLFTRILHVNFIFPVMKIENKRVFLCLPIIFRGQLKKERTPECL